MSEHSPVHRLYAAFEAGDADGMQDCYAEDATFRDEVFELHGAERIGGMWRMLLERGDDLRITVTELHADERTGRATWQAEYTFGRDRRVHNTVEATFRLADGLIVEHVDRFDFWRWSRQALGTAGLLAGWTPFLRSRVQRSAGRSLDRFLSSR